MLNNRIFSWSVWIVVCCALTAPVAVAEQPILIPVIFVLAPTADESGASSSPKVRAMVYRSDPEKASGQASAPRVSTDQVKAPDNFRGDRPNRLFSNVSTAFPLSRINRNPSEVAEANGPIIVTVPMDSQASASVSIRFSRNAVRCVQAESDRIFIPAVDLMTGEATTVGPEYVGEYRELTGLGYPMVSLPGAKLKQARDTLESTGDLSQQWCHGGSDVAITLALGSLMRSSALVLTKEPERSPKDMQRSEKAKGGTGKVDVN
jgi:hypothetical protein